MNEVILRIKQERIIAIVRNIQADKIIDTCKALVAGGITCIEVTFNQSSATGEADTINAIKNINDTIGDKVCLGAGTVMTEKQVQLAVEAGVKYIISPNY
ncbi:MAG: 2-dehydro-3-deoxyphosphogluconate aldolase, partial [Clostridia bacterium]|nr:2-dehydro-3-deoxyphosphogluconate aldolase [Clostridia bacterium]